jgi:hypothetical protein
VLKRMMMAAGVVVLALGGTVAASSPAQAADSYSVYTGIMSWTTYQKLSANQTNLHSTYNYYTRMDRGVTGGSMIRWVKCGYTSTQDAASSVGGSARYDSGLGYQGTLGTNFGYGACAAVWGRKVSSFGGAAYIPMESYFNYKYIL